MAEPMSGQANKVMRNPAQRAVAPSQMAISLTPKEIMGILRRHVLLIVLMAIGGLIAGGLSWFLLLRYNPQFTAIGYVEVLPPSRVDPTQLASQIPPKDILYQARMNKAILISQQSMLEDLLRRDAVRETSWFQRFNNITEAIENLKKKLNVSAQRDSDYVTVAMTCGSPKEAQLIVNQLMELFYRNQETGASDDNSKKLSQLRLQQTALQGDLEIAEKAMSDLRSSAAESGIIMIGGKNENETHTITGKLNELTTERDKIEADIEQITANIGTLEELTKGPISIQTERAVETDPIMLSLGQQLNSLEAELARRLTRFGENHREVRQVRESIKRVREDKSARQLEIGEITRQANWRDAQDQLVFLKSRQAKLTTMRDEAEAKQKDLDAMRARYESLVKSRDERLEMLSSVKSLIEKVSTLLKDPDSPKVKIASMAPEPLEISSPRAIVYFGAGPFLGLLLGIALAFMLELLNDLVRTPSDVNKYLRVSLLGMIPDAGEDDLADGVDMVNVVRQAPYSIISECYRRFRTNIRLSGTSDSLKSILVTSGSQNEGKTAAAVNLAVTLVAEDKKVVFIDTNFRRPMSMQLFPIDSSHEYAAAGLSGYLTGKANIGNVIRPAGLEGMDVIDCGPAPVNPTELLGSSRMRILLDELRKKYDHIILDGAPVLLVSDSKMLATIADSTVVVFNAAITKRGAAQRTLRELNECNANIIGCALVGVKALKGGYFQEMFESYREYTRTQMAQNA